MRVSDCDMPFLDNQNSLEGTRLSTPEDRTEISRPHSSFALLDEVN